mmetsp:Transcript_44235/g.120518  ORF Transcript_44235/g.120518 Transcript_44235/m.120518 type:complete len:210 (-) Transcript_44235:149-778(-)
MNALFVKLKRLARTVMPRLLFDPRVGPHGQLLAFLLLGLGHREVGVHFLHRCRVDFHGPHGASLLQHVAGCVDSSTRGVQSQGEVLRLGCGRGLGRAPQQPGFSLGDFRGDRGFARLDVRRGHRRRASRRRHSCRRRHVPVPIRHAADAPRGCLSFGDCGRDVVVPPIRRRRARQPRARQPRARHARDHHGGCGVRGRWRRRRRGLRKA